MRVQPILLLALLILLRPGARYALAPGSRKVAQILPSAFKNKKLCHLPAVSFFFPDPFFFNFLLTLRETHQC